jgi:probable HAF family extracellular repeat protein
LLESLEDRCLLSYQITDLGTLPGDSGSNAFGLNDSGQVVGESHGSHHAFLWDVTNGMQDLGTLPGNRFSRALGVNDSGQVVGFSYTDFLHRHAVLWDATKGIQDLGTLPGDSFSEARGINDSGQVAGYSCTSFSGPCHAFLWDAMNGMQDLGTLPGDRNSFAFGINNSGQVVGESFEPNEPRDHAVLWDATTGVQDLGTLPGDARSMALGLNDSGQVVGQSESRISHAFLWNGHGMGGLPALDRGAFASGINGNGQVVGAAEVYDPIVNDYFYEPAVWQDGTVRDLNDLIPRGSGWFLTVASAINNAGQIVGGGVHNDLGRAFLLTPDSSALAAPAGRVHSTRSDAQAVLLADSTITAADAGVHAFSLTLATLGDQTLTGTDTADATRIVKATVTGTSNAAAPAGGTVQNATDALFARSHRANASVSASDWEVNELELGVSLLPKL